MLTRILCALVPAGVAAAFAHRTRKSDGGTEIVTVRPETAEGSKQELPMFAGVSGKTAGAMGISMMRIEIPPGGAARAHVHKGFETAIYLLQGRVRTLYGEGLAQETVNTAGDFLFIPAGVPHKPINLSETDPAIAIVSRNDPNEQEASYPIANRRDGRPGPFDQSSQRTGRQIGYAVTE